MMQFIKLTWQLHDGKEEFSVYFLFTVSEAKRQLQKHVPGAHVTRAEIISEETAKGLVERA